MKDSWIGCIRYTAKTNQLTKRESAIDAVFWKKLVIEIYNGLLTAHHLFLAKMKEAVLLYTMLNKPFVFMKKIILVLLTGIGLISSCNTTPTHSDPIPEHETFTIESEQLNELRTINIWTPATYASGSDSLIVLYMPDGGIQEDFPHIANTLNAMIEAQKIPPVILVGIENTQRRKDLSGPTVVESDKEIAPEVGGSASFRKFIESELIPAINKRYRINGQKGIIGESLAGLFVTETFIVRPDLFDFYIAFDPSLWWNDRYLIKNGGTMLQSFSDNPKVFWFGGSGAEDISKNVGDFSDMLKAQNVPGLTWHYSDEKKESHSTIFRAAKEKALEWTFSNL